jgi:methyl-accepting chemotaxis protein
MSSFLKSVLDDERWPIDRLLPPDVRGTVDELRRGRLLIIAALILTAASGFFAVTSLESNGSWLGVAGILGLGSVFAASNLALPWVLGLRRTSILLCVEHVFFVWVSGLAGSGPVDPSVWWLAPAPLVATVLLGSTAGLLSAFACAVGVIGEFIAQQQGVQFPSPAADYSLFVTMASVTVFAAVAGLAFANERARERSEARVEDAVARLQEANEKLSQVAAALTTARDQALADGGRKNAFLEDMRRFSLAQTEALSRARGSTGRLTTTIAAIASSVDTLAAAAAEQRGVIDGVAASATRVQATSQTLVQSVDEAASALGSLRGAASSMQQGYTALRTQAHETARAMGTMEQSSQAVREAAERTATLSSGVIEDAERGALAVSRSKSGVDQIRQTAIHLQTVMEELVERTDAVDRILTAIDEVAAETNVLALNASIIAAQAGEHGRGFSVVADQIKALATRVATSTRESAAVVVDVKTRARTAGAALVEAIGAVDAGQALSQDAAVALDEILRSATEATAMAKSIQGRTIEQARQASSVRAAMQLVLNEVEGAARATADHARAADRIGDAVQGLKRLAPELSAQADDQARSATMVRAAVARVSAMAEGLRDVQKEQTHASQQVFGSVDELHRAQQGVDAALRGLGAGGGR